MIPPQRVPLTEGNLISREWLRALEALNSAATTTDVATLQAAIDALQLEIDAAESAAVTLADRVTVLEAADDGQLDAIFLRRPSHPTVQGSDTQALFAARIFGS